MRTILPLLLGVGLAACTRDPVAIDPNAGQTPHANAPATTTGIVDTQRMKSEDESSAGPRTESDVPLAPGDATAQGNAQRSTPAANDGSESGLDDNAGGGGAGAPRGSTATRPAPTSRRTPSASDTNGASGAGGSRDTTTPRDDVNSNGSQNGAQNRNQDNTTSGSEHGGSNASGSGNSTPGAAGTSSPNTGMPSSGDGTAQPSPIPPNVMMDAGALR